MKIQNAIQQKLQTHFAPSHLEVINESAMHNVPAGSESPVSYTHLRAHET